MFEYDHYDHQILVVDGDFIHYHSRKVLMENLPRDLVFLFHITTLLIYCLTHGGMVYQVVAI